jgi:hypothetical protein
VIQDIGSGFGVITTEEAQASVRNAFVGGGPGALVSALVWFLAAGTLSQTSLPTAFSALFFGGMIIFPVSSLICRVGFRRSASVKGNPLGLVALESTIAMIAGLIAAWLLLTSRPNAVIPVAALAVGAHYFAFRTAYGDRTFWVLGAILTMIGCAGLFLLPGRNFDLMIAFAVVELGFGLWLIQRELRTSY